MCIRDSNEDLQKLYKSLEADFKTEVNMWGNIMEYYHITAPATVSYTHLRRQTEAGKNSHKCT